ncbi:MAG: hypothetical protein LBC55_00715 [Desulfovibrio sp.]|jgi:hypothetical protein|nr:hypothetical protein [Desulfovibrio sp.]
MLTKPDIHALLEQAFYATAPKEQHDAFSLSLNILGAEGVFDSMDAMFFLTKVDDLLSEAVGTDVVLTGDDAFSRETTPFRTMGTLAEYIETLYAQE